MIFILCAGIVISYLFISSIPMDCEEFFHRVDLDTFIEKWGNSYNYFVSYTSDSGELLKYYKNEFVFRNEVNDSVLIYNNNIEKGCTIVRGECNEKPVVISKGKKDLNYFYPLNLSLLSENNVVLKRYFETHLGYNTSCFEITGNYSKCGVESFFSEEDYKICFFDNGVPALFETVSNRFGDYSNKFKLIATEFILGQNKADLFEIKYSN